MGDIYDSFGNVCMSDPHMMCVFAMFLTAKQNQPGSQLTIGGYDSRKVKVGAKWQSAKVVKYPGSDHYPYWTVSMPNFAIKAQDSVSENYCGASGCYAMVDSGTTFISAPRILWKRLRAIITKGKKCFIDLKAFEGAVKCKGTHDYEFPTLAFTFAPGAQMELKGEDYVECFKDGWCKPRLRLNSLETQHRVFIFGDFFIRKHYTIFDHSTRFLLFACATGYSNCKY